MIRGEGNRNADAFLIGEAPGTIEMQKGRVFVGNSGKCLDIALIKAYLERSEIFISNLLTKIPEGYGFGNNQPSHRELERDRKFLMEELLEVKPKYIITLGAVPTSWFKGHQVYISQEIGKTFSVDWLDFEHIIIPTFHPSGIIRSKSWEHFGELFATLAYVSFSLKVKPEEFSKKIETKLVKENELDQVFEEIKKANMLTLDVEEDMEERQLLGLGVATSSYKGFYFPYKVLPDATCTTFEDSNDLPIGMFGYDFLPYYKDFTKLHNFMQDIVESPIPKNAQNAKFDMRELETFLGVPFNNLYVDTMEIVRLVYNNFPYRALDKLIKWLRPTQSGWKTEVKTGTKEIKWSEIPLDTLSEYCCLDAINEHWLVEILRHYL